MSGHFLDLDGWPRRAQYDFFLTYEQPFFDVAAEVPVTRTLAWCRDHERSFSLACWFLIQRAINAVEPFRYRLRDTGIYVHDHIRVATTTLLPDETFRFVYLPYEEDFEGFHRGGKQVFERALTTMELEDRPEDDAVIHGSTLPWVRFTMVSHARRVIPLDAVPKIVLGKYGEDAGQVHMPVAVAVHHGLMDGLHVGRFFEKLEDEFSRPDEVLRAL